MTDGKIMRQVSKIMRRVRHICTTPKRTGTLKHELLPGSQFVTINRTIENVLCLLFKKGAYVDIIHKIWSRTQSRRFMPENWFEKLFMFPFAMYGPFGNSKQGRGSELFLNSPFMTKRHSVCGRAMFPSLFNNLVKRAILVVEVFGSSRYLTSTICPTVR
jgi:hypothetical protein